MPNSRRCWTPCHRIPAQHRRSLWPRKRSTPRGGRGSSDAVWPHHDPLLRPLSDGAEALSPPRTNNPSCRLRSRRTAKAWALQDSIYRRLSQNLLLPIKPQPPPAPAASPAGPPQPRCHHPMPCQGGHPPAPEIHWALLLPGSRQAAAGPIRGWTQCRGWAHGLPPRGSHGDVAHRPGAGWAPPALPPPRRQHPAGPPPCAAPGTRIPPCPASPRVPSPPVSRAPLTCPRSAQAEPPPLPLPPAPSFTSAPFW